MPKAQSHIKEGNHFFCDKHVLKIKDEVEHWLSNVTCDTTMNRSFSLSLSRIHLSMRTFEPLCISERTCRYLYIQSFNRVSFFFIFWGDEVDNGKAEDTCSQILGRSKSQVCTVTLSIPAVLHKAKAWKPGIPILTHITIHYNTWLFNIKLSKNDKGRKHSLDQTKFGKHLDHGTKLAPYHCNIPTLVINTTPPSTSSPISSDVTPLSLKSWENKNNYQHSYFFHFLTLAPQA